MKPPEIDQREIRVHAVPGQPETNISKPMISEMLFFGKKVFLYFPQTRLSITLCQSGGIMAKTIMPG